MNFEQEYYEYDGFWEGEMLQDPANQQRIRTTAEFIPAEAESVVYIGCGNGVFVNYLHEQRPSLNVMGIDRSKKALEFVRTNKAEGDIADLPLPDRSYDCVTCLEVIEHLPVTIFDKALNQLARISKNYIIVSVPFDERLEQNYNQCPSCRSIFNRDLHMRKFNDKDVETLFDGKGFHLVKTTKLGHISTFVGHYTFRKIFYPEQFRRWQTPICPICGYVDKSIKSQASESVSEPTVNVPMKQRFVSMLTWLPKRIWPRVSRPYWVIALFKRN